MRLAKRDQNVRHSRFSMAGAASREYLVAGGLLFRFTANLSVCVSRESIRFLSISCYRLFLCS